MTDVTNWCTGAVPGDAPAHQTPAAGLKALAANALRESKRAPEHGSDGATGAPEQRCGGALGAAGALGARKDLRPALIALAERLGFPAQIVESLDEVEIQAAAEQLAACKGHLDRDGNPLATSLLRFYLNALAERANTTQRVA